MGAGRNKGVTRFKSVVSCQAPSKASVDQRPMGIRRRMSANGSRLAFGPSASASSCNSDRSVMILLPGFMDDDADFLAQGDEAAVGAYSARTLARGDALDEVGLVA